MTAEVERACCHCGSTTAELRPYGPAGADVCHECAFATPEREAQTAAAFDALHDAAKAAGGGSVTIGTEAGPLPGAQIRDGARVLDPAEARERLGRDLPPGFIVVEDDQL